MRRRSERRRIWWRGWEGSARPDGYDGGGTGPLWQPDSAVRQSPHDGGRATPDVQRRGAARVEGGTRRVGGIGQKRALGVFQVEKTQNALGRRFPFCCSPRL